ncbi:MAG: ABC transporter [Oscillospiraceae bacterium]|nr:ABC transporter [Oscillospiraceae bacterium]
MKAVFKRELRSYFTGMTGYIFCFLLLMIVGIYTYFNNVNNLLVNFEVSLGTASYLFLMLAIPILSMRVIAEERRQNTDKLLYSLPLSSFQIVIGKFLAMTVVFAIPLSVVSVYPVILAGYGAVPIATCYSTITAFFLLGSSMLAIGMFMSSITDNQIIAAISTFLIIAVNYFVSAYAGNVSGSARATLLIVSCLIAALALIIYVMTRHIPLSAAAAVVLEGLLVTIYFVKRAWLENLVYDMISAISAFKRLNVFVNDMFDLSGLVFYLSLTGLFVFFTILSFEKRRWS